MMLDRKTTARITRHRLRIRKLRRTEELMRAAINSHRHLEPTHCDVEFMGSEFTPKLAAHRSRHDRLLQAFAELTCERMVLQITNEEVYSKKRAQ